MPPARITVWASVTISWKWVEGSRRRNLRVMESGELAKNSWPSLEVWVSAERREEMWWKTGVVESGLGLD